jgi:CRP-like cAMP-binding protein
LLDVLARAVALRQAPLFAEVPADTLLPVAHLCGEVELEADEALFAAGDAGDSLYVVIRGAVRVERDGQVVAILGQSECVGEMAVLDWEPRSATVIADRPTLLIRLDRNDLLDLLADRPELVEGLAQVLAERLRRLQ